MNSEVMTHSSGKFTFSGTYNQTELNPLWIETKILYQTVRDLPILPALASNLQEELIKKSIFSTAAIEGNPLSEEVVSELVNKKTSGKERAEREIYNLKRAYEYLKRLKPAEIRLRMSEKLIKDLHLAITADIDYPDNRPGVYRSHRVQVGDKTHGGTYTPPKIKEDIVMLMPNFVEWMNSEDILALDPFYRASLAHYHLALIHPFGDGNGRTARLLEALILQSAGIKYVPVMLSNFYYQNMDDYYLAFSTTQRNKAKDLTNFLKFSLTGAADSLREIKTRITFHIRIMALRDYIHVERSQKRLTRRQYDLIKMLIDNPGSRFTLKDLRGKSPYSILYREVTPLTARRDLKRLLLDRLISFENASYKLNLHALEDR